MKDAPYHHGDLRNKLIEAGIALVSEEGIQGFSLRKVAAKCGVSHTALYSHFADIEALTRAMGEYVTGKFTQKLSSAIEGHPTSCEAVSLLGNAYISFFSEHPHYFQFLFYYSNMRIDLDEDTRTDYPPFILFKETAYRLFHDSGMAEADYTRNLLALWSLVHGIASLLTNKCVSYSGNWSDVLTTTALTGKSQHETNHT